MFARRRFGNGGAVKERALHADETVDDGLAAAAGGHGLGRPHAHQVALGWLAQPVGRGVGLELIFGDVDLAADPWRVRRGQVHPVERREREERAAKARVRWAVDDEAAGLERAVGRNLAKGDGASGDIRLPPLPPPAAPPQRQQR